MVAPDCTLCPELVRTRSCVVNGAGVRDAKMAFVGEGPGQYEDQKRRPFVGRAGRVLKTLEWAAGINQYKCHHTNATLCWGKRNPKPPEIDACHPRLIEELRELNPKVIVVLGGVALRSLCPQARNITSVMGFTLYNDELPGIPIVPTYHPSYIMRGNWREVALVLAHFRKAVRIAEADHWEEKLGSYMGITTLEDLRALRDYLLGPSVENIAVDTETCGLGWMDDELLCVSLSGEPGTGYSVPVFHRGEREVMKLQGRGKNRREVAEMEYYPTPYWDLDTEMPEVLYILDEILRSNKPKSGQNIQFDLGILERDTSQVVVKAQTAFGFYVNNVRDDTRLLSSLLSEVSPANLTSLTALWTDMPYYESEVSTHKSEMWVVPDNDLWVYGGADVDVVQNLLPELRPRVEAEGTDWVYKNISIPLIRCARKLEERGIYIDQEHFDKLCRYYGDELKRKRGELDEAVGKKVENATHWQHVQKLVFKDLGLPLTSQMVPKARKECGACKENWSPCSPDHASTSADDLKELNERSPHPILPLLIDIRSAEKFHGTYLDGGAGGGFRAHIREDGRIHPRWNSARAATGRFSCEEPNAMNIPKGVVIQSDEYDIHSDDAVRDMIIASPGRGLLNPDWSQAEVWVMAYETGDEILMNLLLTGEDIHAYVARELCKLGVSSKFPVDIVDESLSLEDWKDAHKTIRDNGKPFVFGMNYGLTVEGCAQRLGCSVDESAPLMAHYTQSIFPGMSPYFLRIRDQMLSHYAVPDKFGRWRHFPEVPVLAALKYKGDLEGVIRQGYNQPPQAGAHDLHSLAHIATERELSSYVWPNLEMHDSLMAESDEDRLKEAAAAVKDLWQDVARNTILPNGEKLGWQIPVDVEIGKSFGSLEKVS